MLRVRPNGSAARVDIVQSTGYQTTDLASMDVFYKWRLVPGSTDNVEIPITYKVDLPKQ
jgi:outer membrane biosynthesis protein TonB